MAKKQLKEIIVALDVGTNKIAALVGEVSPSGEIEVIGFGAHPSRGLKRGVVVNIETTVQSIQHALEEAELMAGCQIQSVITGVAGSHVRSLNSHGIVAIRDHEVSSGDVTRVIEAAKAVAIPADQRVLHILPQEFIVNEQQGVREPVGMSGVRLEARVHIVTGAVSAVQNVTKCVRRCGLQVEDVVLEQLASSYAVLSDDEKELGVCLIDIGGGTTDIAVFTEGSIRHTAVIPIAGDHVTNDVAVALRTPTVAAEQIKITHASVLPEAVLPDETIEVPSVSKRKPRTIRKQALAQVACARYAELYELVQIELRRSGFEDFLTAGLVITGGASKMAGSIELAESIFRMPVRQGLPKQISGLQDVRHNPVYATAVGLLRHGLQVRQTGQRFVFEQNGANLWSRMKSWFYSNF